MAYSRPVKFHFLSAVTQNIVLKEIVGIENLGFEVLTTAVMRIIFWEITLYSPLKLDRRFGGNDCLHFKVDKKQIKKPS
jgi:hypothetical protein